MKILVENNKGEFKQTTIKQLLEKALRKKGMNIEPGSFPGDNYQWTAILQEKDDTLVTISIAFQDDGNTLEEVNVYTNPIKRVVDHDNTTQWT